MLFYKIKKASLKFVFKFIKNEKIKNSIIDFVLGKQYVCNKIYDYWLFGKNNDRFFMVLEHNYKKSKIDWLIFAVVLYEKKQFKRCEEILKEFVKNNNEKDDLEMIADFMLIAPFAKSIGITNEKIEQSIFILQNIEYNQKNKVFEKYIKNKSIAIVGNCDNEIGKNKGKIIDSHDVVVRLNNFETKTYSNDYGTKINVWIINNVLDIRQRTEKELNNLDFIFIRIDIYKNALSYNIGDIIYEAITKANVKILYIDGEVKDSLEKYSKIKNPTSGILFFHYIHKILKIKLKYIDLYAFSFLNGKQIDNYQHYYEKISKNVADDVIKIHSMDKQNEYFIKHYKNKKK